MLLRFDHSVGFARSIKSIYWKVSRLTYSLLLSCVHHSNHVHNAGREGKRNWPGREQRTPIESQIPVLPINIHKFVLLTIVLLDLIAAFVVDQVGPSIAPAVHPNVEPISNFLNFQEILSLIVILEEEVIEPC